jgi:tetratricopeptide (TPR) repeat protein
VTQRLQAELSAGRCAVLLGPPEADGRTIASQYATDQSDADIVWWVRAWDGTTLRTDLTRLAGALPELAAEARAARRGDLEPLRLRLERRNGWLLVLDGAPDPEVPLGDAPTLRALLPAGPVLVTSTNPAWDKVATTVTLGPLDLHEAAAHLVLRSGTAGNTEGFLSLARALAGFPLTLDLAAAHLRATGISPRRYLEHLEAPTLAAVVVASLSAAPRASRLAEVCAFLAPAPLPLWLVASSPAARRNLLGPATSSRQCLIRALHTLRRFDLMTEADLAVRPGIGETIQRQLSEAETRERVAAALRAVAALFHPHLPEEHASLLLPHAIAATNWSVSLGVEPATGARLLRRVAGYLTEPGPTGRLAEAKVLYESALDLAGRAGRAHPGLAPAHSGLGLVLRAQGDLPQARHHLTQAVVIEESTFSRVHPTVASRLNRLAVVLLAEGKVPAARLALERALLIYEHAFGPHHLDVAAVRNNLATVAQASGDLPGACGQLERAVFITRRCLGPAHADVACLLSSLADTVRARGDRDVALAYLEQALAIHETAGTGDCTEKAFVLRNLGRLQAELGDHAGAEIAWNEPSPSTS